MQSITVDLVNANALKLLQDLELMDLIRLHDEKPLPVDSVDWESKYKGAMTRQPLTEINSQLDELRGEWE